MTLQVIFTVEAHPDQLEDGLTELQAVERWAVAVETQDTNLVVSQRTTYSIREAV